jgi:hypothetical protein
VRMDRRTFIIFPTQLHPGACVCEDRYHILYNSTMQGAHGSDSWRGPPQLQVSD